MSPTLRDPGRLVKSPRVRSALAYAAFFAAVGSMLPYLPLYYRGIGFQLGEIGGMLALGPLVGLAMAPAWGALSDRHRGSPRVFVAATSTALAGVALLALGSDRIVVIAGAAVLGAGMAGLTPILDARALETAGGDRSGYGPVRAWGSAGYIVSVLGTGLLADAAGLRSLFIVFAACLVATGLIGLTLKPSAARAALVPSLRPMRDTSRLFGPSGLGVFLLGTFLTWLGMSAVLSFTPLRFEELGASRTIVGLGGALAAGIEVPLMLRYPALAARFGPARVLVAGAGFLAARSVVAALASDPIGLLAASVFAGFGYALFFVGGVTYVSARVPPQLAATALGIFQGVGSSLSQVTAAVLGGVIAAAVGIQGLFGIAIALGAAGTAIIFLAVRRPPPPPASSARRGSPPAQPSAPPVPSAADRAGQSCGDYGAAISRPDAAFPVKSPLGEYSSAIRCQPITTCTDDAIGSRPPGGSRSARVTPICKAPTRMHGVTK
ncbi:MAG: MFS transporter [Chloroflexi bacterium]|nr:MFS transporter [Chloroflexota bacterium]